MANAAGQANQVAVDQQELLSIQAFYQSKFHIYRNGLRGYFDRLADIRRGMAAGNPGAINRMADIVNRMNQSVPRQGNFDFSNADRRRLRALAVLNRVPFRTAASLGPGPELDRQTREVIRTEFRRASRLLGSSFRYIKNLGSGGNGMATLWRYQPDPGQDHRVVMKTATGWFRADRRGVRGREAPVHIDTDVIRAERAMMTLLARAPHIVHRFFVADHPAQNRGTRRSRRVQNMMSNIDNDNGPFILMDYCKFGDLHNLLTKAAKDMPDNTERYFPEPVLWRFFDCLVKACMAMECPPRIHPANLTAAGGNAPTAGPHLPEVVAPGVGVAAGHSGIVHFDLDPSNVFIGGYDPAVAEAPPLAPAHTSVPRLQVADFGLAEYPAQLWQPAVAPPASLSSQIRRRRQRWLHRDTGKYSYLLPEQFSVEWDSIPRFMDPSDMGNWWQPPPITSGPGRYSYASNVWQIGMVMKTCLTLVAPDKPPYAGRMSQMEPPGPANQVPPEQQAWTFGWSLLDPNEPWRVRYEFRLRRLVAMCLMARQDQRPDLQQLQAEITAQLALPGNQVVPQYWPDTFFGDPPPPGPPEDTASANFNIDPFFDYN